MARLWLVHALALLAFVALAAVLVAEALDAVATQAVAGNAGPVSAAFMTSNSLRHTRERGGKMEWLTRNGAVSFWPLTDCERSAEREKLTVNGAVRGRS